MDLPRIAIPSLNRQTLISDLTLKFLSDAGYPSRLIDIFVDSYVQANEYIRLVPPHLYENIIVGVRDGLANQRNFISHYYPDNEIYLSMDDDVKSIVFKTPPTSFCDFIRFCVQEMNTRNVGLMGVLPNSDKRRMKDTITEHLTHILGSFFLIKNNRDIVITINEKEDYQRSILYYLKYGKVLRYCKAGVDTRYAVTPGGLQTPGRNERMVNGVDYLVSMYPDIVTRKDKNGLPDISLNWRHKISQDNQNGPNGDTGGVEQITNPN
jgi:hypothetical protein